MLTNGKTAELRRSSTRRALHFANITMHPLLHRLNEGRHLRFCPLQLKMNPPIRQIAHKPAHLKLLGNLQCRVTEPHSLHATGERNHFMLHIRHGAPVNPGTTAGSIRKSPSFTAVFILHLEPSRALSGLSMSNYDSDGPFESEWDDRGDLAWNEFDWERYLREQEETLNRYLAYYETFKGKANRIDEVARLMDWESGISASEGESQTEDDDDASEEFGFESEVYTLHKNPIFISTRALYLLLRRNWELLATDARKVPQPLALRCLSALHAGEDLAMQAIHALEFGDYAMAISLFKRALSALNQTFAVLNELAGLEQAAVDAYRADAHVMLFDLREIWLRVISECRSELERPIEDDDN